MSDAEFGALLERLLPLPAAAFWRECFSRSAATRSLPPDRLRELGRRADSCGRAAAKPYIERAGTRDLDALCAAEGLILQEMEEPQPAGQEIFALFEEPATIYLRSDLMRQTEDRIRGGGWERLLGRHPIRDILLAHEFYHVLESRDPALFTVAHRENAGWLKLPRQLQPLREIGAMAFADELLGLGYSPFVLDCVMLGPEHRQAAEQIAQRLLRFAQEEGEAG